MIATVKCRLCKALDCHLKRFIASDSEVEQELCELLKNLSGKCAG